MCFHLIWSFAPSLTAMGFEAGEAGALKACVGGEVPTSQGNLSGGTAGQGAHAGVCETVHTDGAGRGAGRGPRAAG